MVFPISFSHALLAKFKNTVFGELARRMRTTRYFKQLHSKDNFYSDINEWLKKQVNHSPLAEKIVMAQKWRQITNNDDYLMRQILVWVKQNLKYMSDKELYGQVEYWATPDETIEKSSGDCEDGSILIFVLAALSGVDMRKVYLTWGSVIGGGHCYITYIRDWDGEEVVMDWCYWYTSIVVKLRKWIGFDTKYIQVWGRAWLE